MKNKMSMFAFFFFLASLFCSAASAMEVNQNLTIQTLDGSFNYTFVEPMNFSHIAWFDDAVEFNYQNISIIPYSGTGNATVNSWSATYRNLTLCGQDQYVNISLDNVSSSTDMYDVTADSWTFNFGTENVTINATSTCKQILILNAMIITINEPLNATDLDGTFNVTFSETTNDSIYSLNGATNVSMGAVLSYETILTSGYLQGANEIRVCANDSVGNMNCTSRVWTTEPNTTVHHGIDLINLRFYPDNLSHKYLMPINENSSNPAYKVEPTTYPDSTLEAWLDENMTAGSWYTISNTSSYTTGINLTDSVQGVNWTVPSLSNVSVWIWLSLDAPNLSLLNLSNRINFNFTR